MHRRFRLLAILAVLPLLIAHAACADDEFWYVVELAGQRAGWMHASRSETSEQIKTTMEMTIAMNRGETPIEIEMATTFVETPNGEPISATSRQLMGSIPTVTTYTYKSDSVIVVTTQGAARTERVGPLPEGEWLTPDEARQYIAMRLKGGADKFSVRAIDPGEGITPYVTLREEIEKTTFDRDGHEIEAFRCVTSDARLPTMKTVELLDRDGVMLESHTNFGGMGMVVRLSTRELATGAFEAPEFMVSSFVEPSRKIARPRSSRRARYTLRTMQGDMPDLPSAGTQRVTQAAPNEAVVEVDVYDPLPAPDDELENDWFRDSNAMMDFDDPRVRRLIDRAAKGDTPSERAESMRRFVHGYIREKSLSVAFASAPEIARTREGDCTEHATLLATLLRADGIPSRVVSGLIYADQFAGAEEIFGYHMWTQALLERNGELCWVDLDATLPNNVPTDATHIALGNASFDDRDGMTSLSSMASLLGNLEIIVESIE